MNSYSNTTLWNKKKDVSPLKKQENNKTKQDREIRQITIFLERISSFILIKDEPLLLYK